MKQQIVDRIAAAIAAARQEGTLKAEPMPQVSIEAPASPAHGDYSSNVALLLAASERLAPHEVAARIAKHLAPGRGAIERVEVAAAGFLNLFLAPGWYGGVVRDVRRAGSAYGRSSRGCGQSVQIEFVSANPNGPLHVGHGRAAALGDAIARLMEWSGWRVSREYYINDATNSTQMINFGRSLCVRYQQALGRDVPLPEDGYEGEYVTDIAAGIAAREGDRYLGVPEEDAARLFTEMALAEMLAQQRADLERFGVSYDVWFSEETLHASGAVAETLGLLKASGYAYEAEGALWLRSTALGDDKDRVLVRATGAPTYLAADAAYHRDKFARGFDRAIDIWGPDHHGYVVRTRAAMEALGIDPSRLEILIHQIVRLFKGGELVRMSKRAGDIVPLADLVDEVGRDAARFFFLMRKAESHLDFDIDLAKKEGQENPVYYVQYAHARTCSILRKAEAAGIALPPVDADPGSLSEDAERALVRVVSDFPDEVALAADTYQPHRVAAYAQALAAAFHPFYDTCQVLGEGVPPETTAARLALVDAARVALANALEVLGITALAEL